MTEDATIKENRIRVRDLLASLPREKFDMRRASTGGCGSPACIMGWTETLMQPDPNNWRNLSDVQIAAWIGLTPEEGDSLFYPPSSLRMEDSRTAYDATPAEAVRVLDHLIATGEVDWSAGRAGEAGR